jgi:plasmid stabilization system protein ParE
MRKKPSRTLSKKTDSLEAHPFIGRAVPELNDKNIREISCLSYRIIYQLINEQIYTLAIVHKRQQ